MAKLLGGTQVYGNTTINSYAVISGNALLSGGNVSIGSGNTSITSIPLLATGNNYIAGPTVTISAPTALYGATATANANITVISIAANINGGTGYSVGNVLTAFGPNANVIANATFTVTSVGNALGGSGNITGLSVTTGGTYIYANTNPLTFTLASTGAGTGANAFVYYGVATPTIVYNGLNYVEPATATFSGGGGSGATAYPQVGGQANVNILGSTLSFRTAGGELLKLVDSNSFSSAGPFYNPLSITRYNAQNLTAVSAANQNLGFEATGFGSIYFRTNFASETQMLVTKTASAVNYLSITGATTGNNPTITVAGSDTNVNLLLSGKGTGNVTTTSPVVITNANVSTATGTGALQVSGGVGIGGNVYIAGITNHAGNVAFDGSQVTHYDSIIDLHTYGNLAAWAVDDGKDIGIRMHYYNGVDSLAFMGLENSSKTLQFLINATETNSNVTGTFGNAQMGSMLLSNATASTGTTSGALQVAGGAGIAGNLNVGANVVAVAHWGAGAFTTANVSTSLLPTANATINSGAPTAYWGTTWSGNIVSNTQLISAATASTSNVTGALVVNGGAGIGGSMYVGNRSGFVWGANNVSSAYTVFNNTFNCIDTVFG